MVVKIDVVFADPSKTKMDFLNEAKRVNMAANNEMKTPHNAPPERILAERTYWPIYKLK